jgi:hypothetical protein
MVSFDELSTLQTKNAPPTEIVDEASEQGDVENTGMPPMSGFLVSELLWRVQSLVGDSLVLTGLP